MPWFHHLPISQRKCGTKTVHITVPYAYAGATVDLRVGAGTIVAWHGGSRLCTHRLLPSTAVNQYSTNDVFRQIEVDVFGT